MPALGKDAVFKLDNSAGTLVDLSTYVDSVDGLPGSVDMQDVTTFGATGKRVYPGLKDGQIRVTGVYETAVHTHFSGIFGLAATQTFEFGPEGGTAGKPKITGECRVAEYTAPVQVGDVLKWSATLQLDGAVTFTTF